MALSNDRIHDKHLDNIADHVERIGLDRSKVLAIFKPHYFNLYGTCEPMSLPDLIIVNCDGSMTPMELKACMHKRDKAIDQLYYGRMIIEDVLNGKTNYGLFVVYDAKQYHVETVNFKQ